MSRYDEVKDEMRAKPAKWLVTGVAGFIGSNLLEALLELDQEVVGLDNLSTGHLHNLDEVRQLVGAERWNRFRFIEGDIRTFEICREAVAGVDYVLHQAALGSVPRSIDDPVRTNDNNVAGFLNMLVASRDEKVKRFVYAASSSTYGDHPDLPKREDIIGNPLSPYAVTKYVNELYATVFSRCYEFHSVGLRYFNVFGPRQDPNGAYAAVIPKWIEATLSGKPVKIYGDGETTRDFCFIKNAVQANILAARCCEATSSVVLNIAFGEQTSLNTLYASIEEILLRENKVSTSNLTRVGFRSGDIQHSLACIAKAKSLLGYEPTESAKDGLEITCKWFLSQYLGLKSESHS